MDREEHIRQRAHSIWEREGCPQGRHQDHWDQACRELEQNAGAQTAMPGGFRSAGNPGLQQSSSSGLVGADDTGTGAPGMMGVDDVNVTGSLDNPNAARPTTGRSKLVGT